MRINATIFYDQIESGKMMGEDVSESDKGQKTVDTVIGLYNHKPAFLFSLLVFRENRGLNVFY